MEYFIVEITPRSSNPGNAIKTMFTRLVKANNLRDAWDKIREIYSTRDFTFNILDTIK